MGPAGSLFGCCLLREGEPELLQPQSDVGRVLRSLSSSAHIKKRALSLFKMDSFGLFT